VKNHVTALLRIFGVKTRVQVVLAANRQGYTRSAFSALTSLAR